ncbi:RNA polymerase sigma factor [Beijerinckiaceae bacterium RH AL1]|nr:sigma-70 family RNA polymerase sigma factor [Beijerinckiaceae bacterium]VVB44095.1 RNA polymerase sigma factor [Beijerinckiaceae bacterium RH CH11]VVB44122.1 RNA polymerase sigma factor [Beijerinckiaceae bacterium RH AL8]VVC54167.1 RNA polymerase sigma factor [Beijerinckiaceae bacterium RH AL1]
MPATERTELDSLLVAVADADRAAFRRLYDLTAPKLFATILRIVKVKASAEEILQDVYLRVWQNAGSYSPEAAPARVWMNSIARNRAIDVLRQKTPASASSLDDGTNWFERIAEDRDREADLIDVASLRHCLGTIEPQARDCVLAAYYQGLSREELAQRYARPVNTIKTWLHRSLASLRACLDEGGA